MGSAGLETRATADLEIGATRSRCSCGAVGAVAAHVSGLDSQDFFEAASEAFFVDDEFGLDECVDQFEGEGGADNSCAENDDVHIVVFNALMGGVGVVAHAGADAGDLVGGDADTYAGAADENAARGVARLDGETYALGEVGIVVFGLDFECAEIEDLMAALSEIGAYFFLEGKAGVVGGDD